MNSKRVKVVYWPQKGGRGDYFLLRCTKNVGGQGNPLSAIGANAFCTTNFQYWFAMRGGEFHGYTRCDGQTRIPGIDPSLEPFLIPMAGELSNGLKSTISQLIYSFRRLSLSGNLQFQKNSEKNIVL